MPQMRPWPLRDLRNVTATASDVTCQLQRAQRAVIDTMAAVAGRRLGTQPILGALTRLGPDMAIHAGHLGLFGVHTVGCTNSRSVRRYHDGVRLRSRLRQCRWWRAFTRRGNRTGRGNRTRRGARRIGLRALSDRLGGTVSSQAEPNAHGHQQSDPSPTSRLSQVTRHGHLALSVASIRNR